MAAGDRREQAAGSRDFLGKNGCESHRKREIPESAREAIEHHAAGAWPALPPGAAPGGPRKSRADALGRNRGVEGRTSSAGSQGIDSLRLCQCLQPNTCHRRSSMGLFCGERCAVQTRLCRCVGTGSSAGCRPIARASNWKRLPTTAKSAGCSRPWAGRRRTSTSAPRKSGERF